MWNRSLDLLQLAVLDVLAFDGASKRNRPQLQPGALIYARVSLAAPFTDIEITCQAPGSSESKKDWMSGQSMYGELPSGGFCDRLSIPMCKSLLRFASTSQLPPTAAKSSDPEDFLHRFGAKIPFEFAIGANGSIWLKCEQSHQTVHLANALKSIDRNSLSGEEAIQIIQTAIEQSE